MASGPYRHRRVAAHTIRTSPNANTATYITRAAERNPLAGEVAVIFSTTRENADIFRRTRAEATDCPDASDACPRCSDRPLPAQGVVLGSSACFSLSQDPCRTVLHHRKSPTKPWKPLSVLGCRAMRGGQCHPG